MAFEPERVVVEAVDDRNWRVVESFAYHGNTDTFVIERGMETDFASVPRVFAWFLPRYGRYTLAAILHDYLWRHLAADGKLRYVDADGIFRRAMRQLGVPFLQRWIMWSAVRWGALAKRGGREGWLVEAPRVLLFTILASPFLVPAAALVGISLAAFQIVELVAWIPLAIAAKRPRAAEEPPRKQVNAPALRWSL